MNYAKTTPYVPRATSHARAEDGRRIGGQSNGNPERTPRSREAGFIFGVFGFPWFPFVLLSLSSSCIVVILLLLALSW